MRMKCLGSSSAGNCYILENSEEALVIECGVKFKDVKIALGFNISKIAGCIISHEHSDHSAYIRDFMKCGIRVFCSDETQDALVVKNGERPTAVPERKSFHVGGFTITPFLVPHDRDIECYGYLIYHSDFGKLLFATDCQYIPYTFVKQNINNIMIECNYSKEYINCDDVNRNRVLTTHMELHTTKDFLKLHNSEHLRNVFLLHLSDKNSSEHGFKKEVGQVVSCPVYIATHGLDVELRKDK